MRNMSKQTYFEWLFQNPLAKMQANVEDTLILSVFEMWTAVLLNRISNQSSLQTNIIER